VNGPAIAFRVGVQAESGGASASLPTRDARLVLGPSSSFTPFSARPASGSPVHPNGALAFDRSTIGGKEAEGYRFFVSYPADLVMDTTPSTSPVDTKLIR
jgi:hypothetical protein